MIVMKFGGTSVGGDERMKNVAKIVEYTLSGNFDRQGLSEK